MVSPIFTVPNALSLLRLAGVPLYLFLISEAAYGWAVVTLVVAGATDYLDGKIARRFNQTSRIGELLDPAADRLYVLAILFSLWDLKIIPFFILFLIIARDVVIGMLLIWMRRYGLPPFKVTYLGKAATFNLLYAFPILLLTIYENGTLSDWIYAFGWAFSVWGVVLYIYTGVSYFRDGVLKIRRSRLGGLGYKVIG
jgi:cardiolipin synthase